MYLNNPTKVLTGEVRLSYCNLVTPKAPMQGNGEPKYSVTLLIPKSDTATKADIDASINAAIQAAVSEKWKGVRPPVIPPVVHDGDGVRRDGNPFGEECKGHWVLSARSTIKPQVVHQSNISCQLDPADIYSGMYARVTITFFGYDTAGSKGIGCSLGNVMKTRDGDPLAGGANAETDFAGLQTAPQVYAQPAYSAPAVPVQPAYTAPTQTAYGTAAAPMQPQAPVPQYAPWDPTQF